MKRLLGMSILIIICLLAAPVAAGEASDLAVVASWTSDGVETGGLRGQAVAIAGDVDGDGYDDLLFGAPKEADRKGVAYLFAGTPQGPDNFQVWSRSGGVTGASYGWSLAGAGDINGDGYDDIAVGAYRFHDDYPANTSEEGLVEVFYGSSGGLSDEPDWSYQSDFDKALLGYSVSGAGDVNKDGYADVIVGARGYSETVNNEGGVFVFYGSPDGLGDGPDWTATGGQSGSLFGHAVAGAGDVDGDGYDDVLIGSPGYDLHLGGEVIEFLGAVYLYLGSADGLMETPAWVVYGETEDAWLGYAVAGPGDLNGDGYDDIAVSEPEYTLEDGLMRGRVHLYYGHPAIASGGQALSHDTLLADMPLSQFADALAAAGDVNRDGYADLLVGAWMYFADQRDEGRAYIYPGGPAGLASTPIWIADGDKADATFGYSMAGDGDINGDGLIDIVVGAPDYRINEVIKNAGKVFAFEGMNDSYGNVAQIFLPFVIMQTNP